MRSRVLGIAATAITLIVCAPAGPPSAKSSKKAPTAAASSPASAAAASPASASPADDGRIKKLARILRAADRRIVDDDIVTLLSDADPAVRAAAARGLGQIADQKTLKHL